MRKICLLFFFLSCTILVAAQTITGTITDTAGKPLSYASVFIKETGKGTHAGNDGRYSLKTGPGSFTLVCQYVGYQKEEKKIVVSQTDQQADFRLVLQGMVMSEVVLGQVP
mgnify:CR=1 FL=1